MNPHIAHTTNAPLVYLAGPITNQSYDGATLWRLAVARRLAQAGILALDPMRGKAHLMGEEKLEKQYLDNPMSTPQAILTRDHWDVLRSDVVLVNLLNAERISLGTVMEIAWAYDHHKPIVLVMEEGGLHDHAMVTAAVSFIARSLNEGVEIVQRIVGTGFDQPTLSFQEAGC